jgi:SAM-dependent methyltransferase
MSFGATADAYAGLRPGYPADVVDWMLDAASGPVARVADVGAGTGAFTRTLAARGLEVTAYEPDPDMLDRLRAALPQVEAAQAPAERLPAADAAFDAVVVAQAWHWMDAAAASTELARVVRPGGALGIVWNLRDLTPGWARELGALIGGEDSTQRSAREDGSDWLGVAAPWGALERHEVPHAVTMTADQVVGLVATFSYVRLRLDADAVMAEVRRIVTEHPDVRGRASFPMPYVTVAYRCIRG